MRYTISTHNETICRGAAGCPLCQPEVINKDVDTKMSDIHQHAVKMKMKVFTSKLPNYCMDLHRTWQAQRKDGLRSKTSARFMTNAVVHELTDGFALLHALQNTTDWVEFTIDPCCVNTAMSVHYAAAVVSKSNAFFFFSATDKTHGR